MYLSRLVLNLHNRDARRDLADCHALHRRLLSAFPLVPTHASGARARLGVLYRVESSCPTGAPVILVQSRVAPDWSRLPPGYLLRDWPGGENPACKAVDAQFAALRTGMRLVFRLRANPTKKIATRRDPDGPRRNGTRVELWREADQLAWLARKASSAGFEVLTVRARPGLSEIRGGSADQLVVPVLAAQTITTAKVTGQRPDRDKEGQSRTTRLTFGSVLFEGELRVVDADRFRQALVEGIGSGKAYGFGLLSVAPARRA